MRSGAVTFAVVFAVGVAALIALGVTRTSGLAYSTGVQASVPVAVLASGDRACQGPYRLPSGTAFDRVAFSLTTYGRPGAPVRVDVREADGRVLASGELARGYPDFARAPEHVVPVDRVETSALLEICFVNPGGPRVGVLGQPGFASPHTTATVNGRSVDTDMAVTLRTEGRSLLALLPDMADRAARFRAGWVSPALYAVLALLLVLGAPIALVRAVARAGEEDRDARA